MARVPFYQHKVIDFFGAAKLLAACSLFINVSQLPDKGYVLRLQTSSCGPLSDLVIAKWLLFPGLQTSTNVECHFLGELGILLRLIW